VVVFVGSQKDAKGAGLAKSSSGEVLLALVRNKQLDATSPVDFAL